MNARNAAVLIAVALVGTVMIAAPPAQEPQAAPEQGRGRAAGPGQPGGRGQRGQGSVQRKRVLAWADTRNGIAQHESVGHALSTIERLGYESGMWDTYIRTDSDIVSKTPKKT